VAAHARILAGGLAGRGIRTRFLTTEGASVDPDIAATTSALRRRSREALSDLLSELATGPVLLHYSNYGFHDRGCPRWLVDGLESWRSSGHGRRLVTVFHELYATGRPWQSSFWLSPLQRSLAARTCTLSDARVTSLRRYAERLRSWSATSPLELLPVFSTAGESETPAPLADRRPQVVVFGSAGVRARGYDGAVDSLAAVCRGLALERIVDVGPEEVAPRSVKGVPVERRGLLAAEDLRRVLAESRAGFVAYPSGFLGKSTIFAAYCAHGLLPVCAWPGEESASEAPPCWRPETGERLDDGQALAARAHAWYQSHSLTRQVRVYGSLLQ
jgi:hypothetical protein